MATPTPTSAYLFPNCPLDSTPHGTNGVWEPYPQPVGRGTTGILSNCLVTFGLCVWTTVHPNVLLPHSTNLTRRIHKIMLMLVAAFVPEAIMLSAFGEWRKAKELHQFWRKHHKYEAGSEDSLGIEGAFFVLMGGFTVGEVTVRESTVRGTTVREYTAGGTTVEESVMRKTRTSAKEGEKRDYHYTSTLTPDGFIALTKSNQISKDAFHKKYIIDKGKASSLAKAIVFLQASRFIV